MGSTSHPVELITREDQHLIHIPGLEQLAVLAYGIGGALKPARAVGGLLGRQHLHEAAAETGGEVVGKAEVAVERLTVELGEGVDLENSGVDAVADRDVDQAVLTAQRYRWFGPGEVQGLQTRAGTASENDRKNTLHALSSRLRWK